MNKAESLGSLLRDERLRRNWTQHDLAALASCDVSTISHVERRKRVPDEALAAALEQALDTGGKLIEAANRARRNPRPGPPGSVPSQLPPAPQHLLGRDQPLAQLDHLVAEASTTPIVALDGGAGVGKSALALSWAHRTAHRYPDGQLVVRLGGHHGHQPTTAADALAGMLSDLGARTIPQGVPARSGLLRSLLHGRRMLLLLDDADSSEQVAPLLPGSATCTVLITSRRRLTGLTIAGSASRLALAPLEIGDTATLLTRLLPTRISDADALTRIAEGTAGLPLAARAAAEVVTDHPGWNLAELAEHLAGPRRLQVLSTAALTHPAASVRAAFAASARSLSSTAAALFRTVGQHSATVTVTDAQRLLASPLDEAEEALTELVGESLLAPTLTGGWAHGLLQAYAAELAAQPDTAGTVCTRRSLSMCA